jgi:hypothetical protein
MRQKSEVDDRFELFERDVIYNLQFVPLYFHGIGFVTPSGTQQYKMQRDKI